MRRALRVKSLRTSIHQGVSQAAGIKQWTGPCLRPWEAVVLLRSDECVNREGHFMRQ